MSFPQSTEPSSDYCKFVYPEMRDGTQVVPFSVDRDLFAAKSAKIAALLKQNSQADVSSFIHRLPGAGPETIEQAGRFCHGLDPNITPSTAISLCCLAYYLEMTESHCPNNLIQTSFTFLRHSVLPSWNDTVLALQSAESTLPHAVHLGLVPACVHSLAKKAFANPRLLGVEKGEYKVDARKKLFTLDRRAEDLTTLPPQLYEPAIKALYQKGVPPLHIAESISTYLNKRIVSLAESHDDRSAISIYERNAKREVIEAVERVLPRDTPGILPSSLLFQILNHSIVLEASRNCINGVVSRIGIHLSRATVQNLTTMFSFRTEVPPIMKRMLNSFYSYYKSVDRDVTGELIAVANLLEEFLAVFADCEETTVEAFAEMANMAAAAALPRGEQRYSDGMYRAIAVYLDRHRILSEKEREEVCEFLDCRKLSQEACEHAIHNELLPTKVMVQVLFAGQQRLSDAISREMRSASRKVMEEESTKLISNTADIDSSAKTEKVSMWKQIKKSLGCAGSDHCYCDNQMETRKKKHQQ